MLLVFPKNTLRQTEILLLKMENVEVYYKIYILGKQRHSLLSTWHPV